MQKILRSPRRNYLVTETVTCYFKTAFNLQRTEHHTKMFENHELLLLHKLLTRMKYTDFDVADMDDFVYSPITNNILGKLTHHFQEKIPEYKNRPRDFKFESHYGDLIKKRLSNFDELKLSTLAGLFQEEITEFAVELIGPMDYEEVELHKLADFINNLVVEKSPKKVSLTTKSSNEKVRDLNRTIAISEKTDFEFWNKADYFGLKKKFLQFGKDDLQDLDNDLSNWNKPQLRILAGSVKIIPEIFGLEEICMSALKILNEK